LVACAASDSQLVAGLRQEIERSGPVASPAGGSGAAVHGVMAGQGHEQCGHLGRVGRQGLPLPADRLRAAGNSVDGRQEDAIGLAHP
jgi:hypothetical protein